MKKKFTVLTATALFSMGLAFYANDLKNVEVLLDSNVEALSDDGPNDPNGNCPYVEFGTSPNRVIVDMETHVLAFENMKQAYDTSGNLMNGCLSEPGGICVVHTTTWVYNTGQIMSYVESVLKILVPLIEFLILH